VLYWSGLIVSPSRDSASAVRTAVAPKSLVKNWMSSRTVRRNSAGSAFITDSPETESNTSRSTGAKESRYCFR
jgi:hypothetical protein